MRQTDDRISARVHGCERLMFASYCYVGLIGHFGTAASLLQGQATPALGGEKPAGS